MNNPDIGKVRTKRTSFDWVIEDFSTTVTATSGGRHYFMSDVPSPGFSTYINHVESKWKMILYPKGDDDDSEDASIYLIYFSSSFNSSVTVRVNEVLFSIVRNGKEIGRKPMNDVTFTKDENSMGTSFIPQTWLKEESASIVENDRLTIRCTIVTEEDGPDSARVECSKCSGRLGQFDDFEKLIGDKKSSDVILQVGSQQIHAHKAILSVRSAVFAAMFDNNGDTKQHNVVEIEDLGFDVLKKVLQFVYAGKVDGLDEAAGDLLAAADKYCLDGLKARCEETIFDNVTVENSFEFLSLAESHNAVHLKSEVMDFILAHAREIVDMPDFKTYGESHPQVVCEVLRALVHKKIRRNE